MTKNNFGAKFLKIIFLLITSLVQKSNNQLLLSFLGAFEKFLKAAISFTSVRPPVRMEQLGSHWADCNAIWYFSRLRKSIEAVQVSLKSG
jgi:DNA-binding FadR family transcriptional regulator